MVVAAPLADVSQTVVQQADALDDAGLSKQLARLRDDAVRQLGGAPERVEFVADVRFGGQSHELQIPFETISLAEIDRLFRERYASAYGRVPSGRLSEIVTLRARARGKEPQVVLPALRQTAGVERHVELISSIGARTRVRAVDRPVLRASGDSTGSVLLLDAEATTYIPTGWRADARADGTVVLHRSSR
jgi:N-methylhydantoinase A/oxoprolinase/acetone carboxylase beta subunit